MLASLVAICYWLVQEIRQAPFSVKIMMGLFVFSSIITFVLYCYVKIRPKNSQANPIEPASDIQASTVEKQIPSAPKRTLRIECLKLRSVRIGTDRDDQYWMESGKRQQSNAVSAVFRNVSSVSWLDVTARIALR